MTKKSKKRRSNNKRRDNSKNSRRDRDEFDKKSRSNSPEKGKSNTTTGLENQNKPTKTKSKKRFFKNRKPKPPGNNN